MVWGEGRRDNASSLATPPHATTPNRQEENHKVHRADRGRERLPLLEVLAELLGIDFRRVAAVGESIGQEDQEDHPEQQAEVEVEHLLGVHVVKVARRGAERPAEETEEIVDGLRRDGTTRSIQNCAVGSISCARDDPLRMRSAEDVDR